MRLNKEVQIICADILINRTGKRYDAIEYRIFSDIRVGFVHAIMQGKMLES